MAMEREQLPEEETTAPEVAMSTPVIGSAWKRKRSKSERMTALASKRWDRGGAQASSSTGTHAQLATPPGPSTISSDRATINVDNPLPAQPDDSSCSDVSSANAAVRHYTADIHISPCNDSKFSIQLE